MQVDCEQIMPKQQRFPLPPTIGDLAAAPLVVKDALRGLRRKIGNIVPNMAESGISGTSQGPLSPLAIATVLLNETRKMTSFGEDIARDVLFRHRDEARLAAFALSGFGRPFKGLGDHHRHNFVSSRYAAIKILSQYLGAIDPLIQEQPIDATYRALFAHSDDNSTPQPAQGGISYDHIALSTVHLEKSGALTLTEPDDPTPHQTRLIFAALGLAEAILTLSTNPSIESTLAALHLAADVVVLRKPAIGAIFEGLDPVSQLSAEYRLLAPPLTEA